jgi:hypothetical protein
MKTFLLSFCLLLSVMAQAQDSVHTNRPLLLYGNITYDLPKGYGFAIGTSIPFHLISKDYKSGNFKKGEFISAELGENRYPFAYTAVIVKAGIGIRYIKSEKHFTEISFNQGILRTAYDGKVYELEQNGNIKERDLFGRTYLTTGFSYSQNWSLNNQNSNAWFIQLRPSAWVQYPYNSFLKLHFSVQAGISYRLKNITARTKCSHLS